MIVLAGLILFLAVFLTALMMKFIKFYGGEFKFISGLLYKSIPSVTNPDVCLLKQFFFPGYSLLSISSSYCQLEFSGEPSGDLFGLLTTHYLYFRPSIKDLNEYIFFHWQFILLRQSILQFSSRFGFLSIFTKSYLKIFICFFVFNKS